jgi:hypothetical protein
MGHLMTNRLRLAIVLLGAMFLVPLSVAQNTTIVTGTVKDVNGLPYSGASVQAQLVPLGITPRIPPPCNGQSASPCFPSGFTSATADVTGSFSMNLASNAVLTPGGTQWQFTVSETGIAPPAGTGPQTCNATLTISGASQSVTASFATCPALSNTSGGAGGLLNAVTFGASPSLPDNAVPFAALSTAATALAYVSVGVPFIRAPITQTTDCAGGCSSFTLAQPGNIQSGDTLCIFVGGQQSTNGALATVTDAGGNLYQITGQFTPGSGLSASAQWYCTAAQDAKPSGIITVSRGTALDELGGFAIDFANVGSLGQAIQLAGNSNNPSQTQPIADNNNIVLTGFSFFAAGTSTVSANTGTLQASFNGATNVVGGAIVTNTNAAANTTLTTSINLSAVSNWASALLEMRSVTISVPTVLFPCPASLTVANCDYLYSAGLTFPKWVTIKCDPGAFLYYIGTAHAMDLGTTLSGTNGQANGYTTNAITVDSCGFKGASNATDGIQIKTFNLDVTVKNNKFYNYGPSIQTSYGVDAVGGQEKLFFLYNTWYNTDGVPRAWLNVGGTTVEPQIIGNFAACFTGTVAGGGACNPTATPSGGAFPLITAGGFQGIVSENNIGFLCPFLLLNTNALGFQITNNSIETNPNQVGNCPAIVYKSGTFGTLIQQNFFDQHGKNILAPFDGTSTLGQANISSNRIIQLPLATPLVLMNNLTGQVGNLSFMNLCSTGNGAVGDSVPCPFIHTLGGNIAQWNNDYSPVLTFSAATTASYTFNTVYNSAPKCVISPVTPGAITFTITTLSTTTLTVTASGAFTGTVNASCNPDAQ